MLEYGVDGSVGAVVRESMGESVMRQAVVESVEGEVSDVNGSRSLEQDFLFQRRTSAIHTLMSPSLKPNLYPEKAPSRRPVL